MFVNWELIKDKQFQNTNIDTEYEFILPRLTKFKVEKVEYVPYNKLFLEYKYRDIPCKRKNPEMQIMQIKHYTLSLASQPTYEQLVKTYKTIKDKVVISIQPFELDKVPLERYLNHLKAQKVQTVKRQSGNNNDQ
jgi:hypothetical protein